MLTRRSGSWLRPYFHLVLMECIFFSVYVFIRFLSQQIRQADFLEVLEHLSNPVSPNVELGSLKVESCRIMDSAKRPLWLVWHNNDSLSARVGKLRNKYEDFLTLLVVDYHLFVFWILVTSFFLLRVNLWLSYYVFIDT